MTPRLCCDERPVGVAPDFFNKADTLKEWNLLTRGWEDGFARDRWEVENQAFGDTYPNQFNPDFEDDLHMERERDRLSLEEWRGFMLKGIHRAVLSFQATGKRAGILSVKLPGKPVVSAKVELKSIVLTPSKRSVQIDRQGKAFPVVFMPVTKNEWGLKKEVPDDVKDVIESVDGLFYLDRMTGAGIEEGFNLYVLQGEKIPKNAIGEAVKGRAYITTAPLPKDEDDKPKIDRRPKRPAPPGQRQAVLGEGFDVSGN